MDIIFKSLPFFFEKEKKGEKTNTIRQVGEEDDKFDSLLWMLQSKEYGTIGIVNPKTRESFYRKITDVSYYDERFIISWKHKSSSKIKKTRVKKWLKKITLKFGSYIMKKN